MNKHPIILSIGRMIKRLKKTGGIYHDRFIVLDYGTIEERIFLCGASSKDAGARVTCIVEDFGIEKYKGLIEEL